MSATSENAFAGFLSTANGVLEQALGSTYGRSFGDIVQSRRTRLVTELQSDSTSRRIAWILDSIDPPQTQLLDAMYSFSARLATRELGWTGADLDDMQAILAEIASICRADLGCNAYYALANLLQMAALDQSFSMEEWLYSTRPEVNP